MGPSGPLGPSAPEGQVERGGAVVERGGAVVERGACEEVLADCVCVWVCVWLCVWVWLWVRVGWTGEGCAAEEWTVVSGAADPLPDPRVTETTATATTAPAIIAPSTDASRRARPWANKFPPPLVRPAPRARLVLLAMSPTPYAVALV